ncbi:ABC transporter ATP-binding protein [Hypericibacter terrae]|jgi:branched-chain amino acid transport system ATP-binding protein|uniref:ABC transporter ATP-binding protein n=1 Tax=Hypericibacter terrae TaxID=2602015 RepID=A0A5J6MFE3_9PROT|nr:ABC transporter ATP-binding protein [Hypericibacter terrae]QEX15777.1 ABC transporter ATP-binding protein [Hypericibacter terrae]
MTLLLEVQDLSVTYGSFKALNGASLRVEKGEIHGLIGPNGSGKTTMLNVVCGFARARAGSIAFADARIERLPVHRRAAMGLGRTFQGIAVFSELSVMENVLVGLHLRDSQSFFRSCIPFLGQAAELENQQRALAALKWAGLEGSTAVPAGTLSFGGQRMLDLARAMVATPSLLLLDEPAAGLNPNEVAQLAAIVREFRARGSTVVVVEHHLKFVMGLCDRITVLNFGQTIAADTPDKVQKNPAVIEAYLGPDHVSIDAH